MMLGSLSQFALRSFPGRQVCGWWQFLQVPARNCLENFADCFETLATIIHAHVLILEGNWRIELLVAECPLTQHDFW
jgi:hypothetical protein